MSNSTIKLQGCESGRCESGGCKPGGLPFSLIHSDCRGLLSLVKSKIPEKYSEKAVLGLAPVQSCSKSEFRKQILCLRSSKSSRIIKTRYIGRASNVSL